MMDLWTDEDIESILKQLSAQGYLFSGYEFSLSGERLVILGTGASARVYEVWHKGRKKKKAALKVIGFGNGFADPKSFRASVEAQKELAYKTDNIVKIIASLELRVSIEGEHTVSAAEKVSEYEENVPEGDKLDLQFVLMEKLSPVIVRERFRKKLTVPALEKADEQEVQKLAYDIGTAVDQAHTMNILHRDIKLENVFVDDAGNYKLGDFGIARKTEDGLASTVAFTKGYGAPEVVGTLDDRYDNTADIYSFGILLYVLLNELRFPGSDSYHPNVYQYTPGFVPPDPVNGSDEFVRIVVKMISYDPDDRYQSMQEVLNELEGLRYGHKIKYRREHRSTPLALGTVFALTGAAVWKLSFLPELKPVFSIWEYLFFGLLVIKGVRAFRGKKSGITGTVLFGMGIYLIKLSGFSWLKVLLLLLYLVFGGVSSAVIGGGGLTVNLIYLFMQNAGITVSEFCEYRWMAVLLLALSIVMLLTHSLLGTRDEYITKAYFSRDAFWIVTIVFFLCFVFAALGMSPEKAISHRLYIRLLGGDTVDWIMSWDPFLVGVGGSIYCIVWMLRERLMIFIERIREAVGTEM